MIESPTHAARSRQHECAGALLAPDTTPWPGMRGRRRVRLSVSQLAPKGLGVGGTLEGELISRFSRRPRVRGGPCCPGEEGIWGHRPPR